MVLLRNRNLRTSIFASFMKASYRVRISLFLSLSLFPPHVSPSPPVIFIDERNINFLSAKLLPATCYRSTKQSNRNPCSNLLRPISLYLRLDRFFPARTLKASFCFLSGAEVERFEHAFVRRDEGDAMEMIERDG